MLDLIEHARFQGCASFARRAVWDSTLVTFERVAALDALVALNDPEVEAIADSISAAGPFKRPFARIIMHRLFPSSMTVKQLVDALSWVPETRSSGGELSRNLPRLVEQLALSELIALRRALTPMVDEGLSFDTNRHAVQNLRLDLVHVLTTTCHLLLESCELAPPEATSVVLAAELGRAIRSDGTIPAQLWSAIAATSANLLQTAMNVGAGLATRSYSNTVVLSDSTSIGSIAPELHAIEEHARRQVRGQRRCIRSPRPRFPGRGLGTVRPSGLVGVFLDAYLAPLAELLARPDITDIFVNRPRELWIETRGGAIECHDAPALDEPTISCSETTGFVAFLRFALSGQNIEAGPLAIDRILAE